MFLKFVSQCSLLLGNCIFLLHNSIDVSIFSSNGKASNWRNVFLTFLTSQSSAVQDMVSPERLTELYPEISEAQASNPLMANIFLGLIPALIWILFFA